ncbi:MAG: hypothetical protein JXR83_20195 [Deltaproteobacteria bacterium]|nr:hypothetical protein [Deltaproteobacteria bacterium]
MPRVTRSLPSYAQALNMGLVDKKVTKKMEKKAVTPNVADRLFADMPTSAIKGIGSKLGAKLAKLGIKTVENLTFTRAAFPMESVFSPHEAKILSNLHFALMSTVDFGGPNITTLYGVGEESGGPLPTVIYAIGF